MEIMPCDVDPFQFFLRHLDASLIHVPVKLAFHPQPRFRGRRLNKTDDHPQRLERSSPPILGDVAEQPVLYLVPFRSARREMGDLELQARLIRQLLQLRLPEPVPAPVAHPAVGGDVKLACLRVPGHPHLVPPLPDGIHCEPGRVGTDAQVDEPFVPSYVVHPVRGDLPQLGKRKVMVQDLHRLS